MGAIVEGRARLLDKSDAGNAAALAKVDAELIELFKVDDANMVVAMIRYTTARRLRTAAEHALRAYAVEAMVVRTSGASSDPELADAARRALGLHQQAINRQLELIRDVEGGSGISGVDRETL